MHRGVLSISSNKEYVKISSIDGENIYFEGDEKQAWRVASFVGTIVGGGGLYAYYEGDIFMNEQSIHFITQDAAGLGTLVEIEFDNVIKRISISWAE